MFLFYKTGTLPRFVQTLAPLQESHSHAWHEKLYLDLGVLGWKKHWWFNVRFFGWLGDPFKGLSELQLGDKKATLNQLEKKIKTEN